MHESGLRQFTVLDAAVLLAATVGGLVLVGQNDELRLDLNSFVMLCRIDPLGLIRYDRSLLARVLSGFAPLLAAWTLALWGLRLRPPRPSELELFRQPGTVACHVGSLTIFLGTLFVVLSTRRNGTPLLDVVTHRVPPAVSLAVAVSWVLLGLSRRWRSEPSWIDRFGLLAGLAWIALLPLRLVVWFS